MNVQLAPKNCPSNVLPALCSMYWRSKNSLSPINTSVDSFSMQVLRLAYYSPVRHVSSKPHFVRLLSSDECVTVIG